MTSQARGTEPKSCPFIRPNVAGLPTVSTVAHYCCLPSGKARIPSRDELVRFCLTGHHGDCPGYRRIRMSETFAHGLA